MRRLTIGVLGSAFALGLACADDPSEPNAFMTMGDDDEVGTETSELPDQLGDEDVDADADSSSTTGDGDGDTTTTTDEDTTTTTDTGGGCGNGVIDDGEQCDGGNLGGFSCSDLGYSGGTLACDPVTCTYDASGCTTDNTTTQGSSTSG